MNNTINKENMIVDEKIIDVFTNEDDYFGKVLEVLEKYVGEDQIKDVEYIEMEE